MELLSKIGYIRGQVRRILGAHLMLVWHFVNAPIPTYCSIKFQIRSTPVRSRAIHCAFGTCDKSHDYELTLKFKLDEALHRQRNLILLYNLLDVSISGRFYQY